MAQNNMNLLPSMFGGQKSEIDFTGSKSKCWQASVASRSARGEFLWSFSLFSWSAAYHLYTYLPLYTCSDPCHYIGPTQTIWNHLPISESSIQSHLQSPSCHVRQHIIRFSTTSFSDLSPAVYSKLLVDIGGKEGTAKSLHNPHPGWLEASLMLSKRKMLSRENLNYVS